MRLLLASAVVLCLVCSGAEAFAPAGLGLRRGRTAPLLAASPQMVVGPGDNVAVYSVFERTGILAAWNVANASPYKGVVQLPPGFQEGKGKLKWNIDGQPDGVPAGLELEYLVSCFPDLQKCVLLSSTGVPDRDSMMSKLNPFNKADEWYLAEEALKKAASAAGVDLTVVRTGDLQGGPFYNCNPDFEGALSGNLFDMTHLGFKLSKKDEALGGKTSRDLAAQCLVDALSRQNVPVVNVVSLKEGGVPCSIKNPMKIKRDGGERGVYVPSAEDFNTAYGS